MGILGATPNLPRKKITGVKEKPVPLKTLNALNRCFLLYAPLHLVYLHNYSVLFCIQLTSI